VVLAAGDRPAELLARAGELGVPTRVLSNGRRGYRADVRELFGLVSGDPHANLHSHLARANLVCRCVGLLTQRPCVATLHGHFGDSLLARAYDLADWTVMTSMDAIVTVTH
jgi:hypothetical protein